MNGKTKYKENGREYGCPCGKYYLSYCALYTHIKTKHDGVVLHKHIVGTRDTDKATAQQKQGQAKAYLYGQREGQFNCLQTGSLSSIAGYFWISK